MLTKHISNNNLKNNNISDKDSLKSKKVDVNILLNRVKSEKKNEIKKNLIITVGALGTLAITGLITII